jgi:hypothetical protein
LHHYGQEWMLLPSVVSDRKMTTWGRADGSRPCTVM